MYNLYQRGNMRVATVIYVGTIFIIYNFIPERARSIIELDCVCLFVVFFSLLSFFPFSPICRNSLSCKDVAINNA